MTGLKGAVQALKATLQADAQAPLSNLSIDDGTVTMLVHKSATKRVPLSIIYHLPEDYPNSGVMLWSEEDDGKGEQLAALCEKHFQDRAPLDAVLNKVCESPRPAGDDRPSSPRTASPTRAVRPAGACRF